MTVSGSTPAEAVDCLVIGAGFAGCDQLIRLRKQGFKVKCLDAADGFGGTWRCNRYPGARVDSPVPLYSLSFPEIFEFNFTQVYPDWQELRQFFDFLDKKFELGKDTRFNTRVTAAKWDDEAQLWRVTAQDVGPNGNDQEAHFTAQHTLWCVGFATKTHEPPFPGRETFKGEVLHTGCWPEGLTAEGLKDKRIAVLGTGASGIQSIQELGPVAKHLTVLQRTPNLCLPMKQAKLDVSAQDNYRDYYDVIMAKRRTTFSGFSYDFNKDDWRSYTFEQRQEFFEKIWAKGGFHFWLATFDKVYYEEDINREAYDFWAKKVAERIPDTKKRELLAPKEPFHTFGTRRPSLEQCFYEVVSQENVDIVSLRQDSIEKFTSKGLLMKSGREIELDILVLATGFDTHSGVFRSLDIRGKGGVSLAEKWSLSNGVSTNLGLTTSGFPNLQFLYGAQAPTAYSNGPSTIDIQGEWSAAFIKWTRDNGVSSFDTDEEAEKKYGELCETLSAETLFHASEGWYMGRNVPNKKVQALNFTGGIPAYIKELNDCATAGYKGYHLTKAA